jgi:hypothetical protein
LSNPENIIRVGHWYKSGDLMTLLPGLRAFHLKYGKKTRLFQKIGLPVFDDGSPNPPLLNKYGQNTSMNENMIEMLLPLLEYQPYIESVAEWKGDEVDFDTINTRDSRVIPIPNSDLYFWVFFVFPQMACDLSEPWIELPPNGNVFHDIVTSEHAIINRTARYTNPYINYYFLKEYQDRVIFSGTEDEHKRFCTDWEIDIPRLIVKDFMELAQALRACKFFLGNQSFHFHLAEGIKKKRILEVCASFPNTLPHGGDGRAFLYQTALEIYFKEFMNGS